LEQVPWLAQRLELWLVVQQEECWISRVNVQVRRMPVILHVKEKATKK
jgi:hypothetical protein